MKYLINLGIALLMTACTSYPPLQVAGAPEYSEAEYEKLFMSQTQSAKQYQGLQNTMIIRATQITPKLADAILARKARIFQWDQDQYSSARAEMMAELARGTQFFVSLYTPGGKLDDLTRKKNLWSILLDTGGSRYKGSVEKISGEIEELAPIYPSHDRFSRPYIISFPVSPKSSTGRAEFIITGPVDSATLSF